MQRDLGKFQTENVELAAKVDLCAGHNGGGSSDTVKPYNEQETSPWWELDSIMSWKLEMMLDDLEG